MKQMKIFFATALSLALMASTLAACGAGSNSDTAVSNSWSGTTGDTGDFSTSDMLYPESSDASGQESSNVSVEGEKMIYTARLEVETTNFDDSVLALDQIVEAKGGYYETRSSSNYDTYRYANYTIRIPAEQYSDFLSQVGQACHVLSTDEERQNVSEIYYDIETRLATQRTKLERLQELLQEAENMSDIITIESAISETELNIEQLTGSLRNYDNRVDYATVTISLREVYKLSNSESPATTFPQRISDAFVKGWHNFVNSMENLAVFLATAWIPVVILLAAGFTALIVWRKKHSKQVNEAATPPTDSSTKES